MEHPARVAVWDPLVRLCHWTLAGALAVAAVTGFLLGMQTLAWHLAAGGVIAAVLLVRVVWGVLGGTYARFAGFVPGRAALAAHLKGLRGGRHDRHLGHNPLGALMVFALLAVSALLVATGTAALGGMFKQGPLRSLLSFAVGRDIYALHQPLAILLLAMVAAHLAGVAFESRRGRESLVRAMLTGRKPVAPTAVAVPPARPRRVAAAVLCGLLLLGGGGAVASLADRPALGVPRAAPDPVFAEQCGACHLAYPPLLAPASTWAAILGDLQHHFGADASLAPWIVERVGAYLQANSAEHWDSLPAHLMRQPGEGSLRLTAAPGWQRMHRGIPLATFRRPPIYRRSDCQACHRDAASGRFAPQAIAVPGG